MPDSVQLVSMCQWCFMDGYWQGLNGKQATWASKNTRGTEILETIQDIELALVDNTCTPRPLQPYIQNEKF